MFAEGDEAVMSPQQRATIEFDPDLAGLGDLVATCTKPYSAMETVLSAFFGSIGIWPNHHVTPEMEAKAREVLEFFEVAHLSDRLMTELSSGEARRVVFARALAHDPKALVLDEPTNSLDIRAQREVRDAIRKLAHNGVTVIVVTHHLPDMPPWPHCR